MLLTFELAKAIIAYQSYKADVTELTAEDLAVRATVEKAFPWFKQLRMKLEFERWVNGLVEEMESVQAAKYELLKFNIAHRIGQVDRDQVTDLYKEQLRLQNALSTAKHNAKEKLMAEPDTEVRWHAATGNLLIKDEDLKASYQPPVPTAILVRMADARKKLTTAMEIQELDAAMAVLGCTWECGCLYTACAGKSQPPLG